MNDDDIETSSLNPACCEFRDRISAQFENAEPGNGAWRRHALACSACRTFESSLRVVQTELSQLRGTPVRDLWPTIALQIAPAQVRPGFTRHLGERMVVAAASALATWGTLAFVAAHQASSAANLDNLSRALVKISEASAKPDDLAQTDDLPELRLLTQLSNRKEGQR